MKRKRRALLPSKPTLAVLIGILLCGAAVSAPEAMGAGGSGTWEVKQPRSSSDSLTATVSLNDAGALTLAVRRGGATVLQPAPVGLVTDKADLSTGLRLGGRSDRTVTEQYTATTGKRQRHLATMNETRLSFTGAGGARMDLVVRVSDQGVAYRYVLPDTKGGTIRHERSAFQLPGDATAWLTKYEASHEQHHGESTASGAAGGFFGYPALFRTGKSYVLLSESGVNGRYAGSRLSHQSGSGRYSVAFATGQVSVDGPLTTPWRAAVIGSLQGVVQSTFTDDIAPPSRIEDTSWIRPGKVAWSWLAGGKPVQRSLEAQKKFVDYAAEHGWPYTLVDDGWKDEKWMPELVEYASSRGVKILAWMRWDDLDSAAERDTVLSRMNDWGVAGLKIDFIGSESQERFRWYDDVLKATADHKLLVNFHGSTVPNGMQRTWPHVMTLEAVRGAEYGGWRAPTAGDIATYPFTRNVVGSMDYTPMALQRKSHPHSTAAELALSVVYESGFQNFAGSLETYAEHPEMERFLEQVPTVWDDTRLLSGRPGGGATLARRSQGRWFMGSYLTGGAHTERTPLTFLGGGRWLVETIRDGKDGLIRETRRVDRGDTLAVPVPGKGGFVAVACPDKPNLKTCDRPVKRGKGGKG
ncbi:glycoside hydrolase family 97 catalytic domain-containing protein [Streptomyces sp. NPDC051907]|uniref:glycoside hydrolase family 97 protein n=1 Tax=Streptomyces sp. NPDC051907 TaxID=3155284 RepID=UPI003443F2C3